MENPFDVDHEKMMVLLEHLIDTPASTEVLGQIIDHLSNHFISEERVMLIGHYPEMNKHIEAHHEIQRFFLSILPRLVQESSLAEEIELSREGLSILKERIILHIQTEDADFMKYIFTYAPEALEHK